MDESTAEEKLFGSVGIDDAKKVVVYDEQDNPAAARVARSLMYYGHPDTAMLDCGYPAWKALA